MLIRTKHFISLLAVLIAVLFAGTVSAQTGNEFRRRDSRFTELNLEGLRQFYDYTLEKNRLKTPARPVLIHIYATWCAPCRHLHAGLESYAASHPEYGYYMFNGSPSARHVPDETELKEQDRVTRLLIGNKGVFPTVLLGRPDGTWTYFTGSRDGTSLKKLIDGVFNGKPDT